MTTTRRFAALWYAYGYLREVVLIFPVYAIMMGAHGISPIELSVLFVVWSASALVFEVPSGVLADRYSRKRLLVLAGAVKGCAFLIWWLVPDFSGYLLGFVVWGFGSSLSSGTSESFLYDSLHARGEHAIFARMYGRGLIAHSLGVATALAAGGFIAERGYTLPLLLSIAAPWASALLAAIVFVEPPRSSSARTDSLHDSYFNTLANGATQVRRSRVVLRIVAMFATLVTAYSVTEEYIGPFLTETPNLSLGNVGIVYAAAFATRTLGMELSHRLPFRSLRAISTLFALGALGLAATVMVDRTWVIATLGVYFAVSAAAEVLLQTRLQNEIDGSARATVTSIAKMAEYAGGLLVYLYIGAIAQFWSFGSAFTAVAALTFALALAFASRRQRNRVVNDPGKTARRAE